MESEELRSQILKMVREYSRRSHRSNRAGDDPQKGEFIPGKTPVPYAGRVFSEDEVEAAVGLVGRRSDGAFVGICHDGDDERPNVG